MNQTTHIILEALKNELQTPPRHTITKTLETLIISHNALITTTITLQDHQAIIITYDRNDLPKITTIEYHNPNLIQLIQNHINNR